MDTKPVSAARNVLYHFLPGIAVTAVCLLLTMLVRSPQVPNALLFYVSALALIPVTLLIMKRHSPSGRVMGAVAYREKQPVWKVLVFELAAFLWAALAMTAGKPVSAWLADNVFFWMKDRFDLAGYLINPAAYPRAMVVLTWAVGLVTASTTLPVVEELYFRGFLLPRLGKSGLAAIFISALLFSLYHLFSPWQFAVRFVALLPMTYFVWKYKDIRIGIVCHVLLNLAGDSLMAIPIVFS